MARQRLTIGTFGEIGYLSGPSGRVVARARSWRAANRYPFHAPHTSPWMCTTSTAGFWAKARSIASSNRVPARLNECSPTWIAPTEMSSGCEYRGDGVRLDFGAHTVTVWPLLSEGAIFATAGLTMLMGFRDDWPLVLFQPTSLVALALGFAARASRSRRRAIEELVTLREDRAAAAERARITAEMHDVVAHSVTVMVALAGGAATGWEKHPERARTALEQLGDVGAHTLEEMQRILRVLRENDADLDRNLESSGHNLPSLEELIDVFKTAGLPVALIIDDEPTHDGALTDPALQTTVYRIVQESLTNTLRHANEATYVEVRITSDSERVVVSVTDNGRGPKPAASVGAGVGLRAMRERATAFGGEFSAGPIPSREDAPGRGWRTRVAIPVREGAS